EILQSMADRLQGLVMRFTLESGEGEGIERMSESMDDRKVIEPELEMCMTSSSCKPSNGKRSRGIRKDSILHRKGM
ncbi:MAG: hypothetical protein SVY53_03570, partial [Chloroflexota bacterium]|nr:hypothetical protein [Chloroflexota bacterium]